MVKILPIPWVSVLSRAGWMLLTPFSQGIPAKVFVLSHASAKAGRDRRPKSETITAVTGKMSRHDSLGRGSDMTRWGGESH